MEDLVIEYIQLIESLEKLLEELINKRATAPSREYRTLNARIRDTRSEIFELYDAVNEMIRGVKFGNSI